MEDATYSERNERFLEDWRREQAEAEVAETIDRLSEKIGHVDWLLDREMYKSRHDRDVVAEMEERLLVVEDQVAELCHRVEQRLCESRKRKRVEALFERLLGTERVSIHTQTE